ncbi:GYF domain-containing protein [Bosea sp. (in: a-proteobacteria)]|uniref:GYF domain-containing protein n=1 Tax=Bosea sp. (in: a-proteobacteria) TaxID=1871050 RepID=UPI003562133D
MTDTPPLPAPIGGNSNVPPPPPHPLDGEWFVYLEGKNYGPYTGHAIKTFVAEGRIDDKTSVCAVGKSEWLTASKDAVLAPLFQVRPPMVGTTSALMHSVPASSANGRAGGGGQVRNDSGTVVQITQHFGPGPGYNPELYAEMGPKSPGLALLLSFFIPGLGQMYNGQIGKGIGMLLLCIVLWMVLLGWVIWIWAMIDAYSSAKAVNIIFHQRAARQWPNQ